MAKILVIDDDPMNRDLLKLRLGAAGHDVLLSESGEAGLALAGQADLVILDVMMPKMDGWNVCRSLRAAKATRHVPIVMLTACVRDVEQLRGFESGATDYVTKPWDAKALMALIERHLAAAHGGSK